MSKHIIKFSFTFEHNDDFQNKFTDLIQTLRSDKLYKTTYDSAEGLIDWFNTQDEITIDQFVSLLSVGLFGTIHNILKRDPILDLLSSLL